MEEEKMTKRFFAAVSVIPGILANETIIKTIGAHKTTDETATGIVKLAYSLADELIKQENK